MWHVPRFYCKASRQEVNFQKSSAIFSSNTTDAIRKKVADGLQAKVITNLGSYLGISSLLGKIKCKAMEFLKERFKGKLQVW
ncbi:hypothetical protein ES332_D11G076100v1 [Gossypium tomentosum]|uniref:Uncharacterized protein n=1 Tax=Gossypium tomentosum TaxID=34277 RepID=A0A5D2IJ47_GOSTO|nr:hypothetical protein ES332_D11G076100v1 [Gossypium tomentosum]